MSDNLPYPLKRHHRASMRLNYLHFYLSKLTGHLIHPKIPIDAKNLRVADVGAGTGIWASEVAVTLPLARVDAFDIAADQFPHKNWRAPNIQFTIHNCFEPFPTEYIQQFDVVNVRFWLCIVNDDVAEPLVENLLTLLKPGGYIQWFESLPLSAHVNKRNGDAPTPGCDKLVEQWKKPAAHSSYQWVEGLPKLFETFNVEVQASEKVQNSDLYQPISAQAQLAGLDEYLYKRKDFGEIEAFQELLAEEFSEGAFVDVAYQWVIGRKLG